MLSITIWIAMIVFVGMMMAKDLIQVSAEVAKFQDKKRSAQRAAPKESYAGDAAIRPASTVNPAERY